MSHSNLGQEMIFGAALGAIAGGALIALGLQVEQALFPEKGLLSEVAEDYLHNPLRYIVLNAVAGAGALPLVMRK